MCIVGGVECRVGGGECTLCGGLEASNRLRNNGTRFRLRHLSRLQKKRAGGPDGWAGSELAALPFAMSDLTEIFQTWESIGCLRTVWNHITQVMIPKAGGLRADGALLSASCAPSAFSVVGGEFIVELGCQEPRNSCGWNVTLWVIKPVAGKTGLVRPRSCNWQSVLPRKSSLLRLIMLRLLITLVLT